MRIARSAVTLSALSISQSFVHHKEEEQRAENTLVFVDCKAKTTTFLFYEYVTPRSFHATSKGENCVILFSCHLLKHGMSENGSCHNDEPVWPFWRRPILLERFHARLPTITWSLAESSILFTIVPGSVYCS